MPNIGPLELVIILVIALLILGPGRLPDVGAALGKGIREARKAATDVQDATKPKPAGSSAPETVAAKPAAARVAPTAGEPASIAPTPGEPAAPVGVNPAPADRTVPPGTPAVEATPAVSEAPRRSATDDAPQPGSDAPA